MTARLVVGIAGGSGSGKTTLAERILSTLPRGAGIRISHDAYYRDLSHLALEERARWNFDHPDALESELLSAHLDLLRLGRPARCPEYDFGTHTRKEGGTWVRPAPVVVVDGVLVLAVKEIRRHLDLSVFVETASHERLSRRVSRDVRERGRSRSSVLQQWDTTVRPMYEEFVEPSKRHADLVIPEGGFDPSGVDRVVERIRAHLDPGSWLAP